MTDYRVGDVVNGHVWTGSAWEPAPPPPARPSVKAEIPTWGATLRFLATPAAVFAWVLVAGVLAGPAINDIGRDMQGVYGSGARDDFTKGIADTVRGLGLAFDHRAALWVLVPLAILLTVVAALSRRATSGPQQGQNGNGP